MNWGWKLTLLYSGFVAMMLTLVVLCVQQDIFLVTEDYYEKDLSYNEHIERMANSAELETDLTYQYTAKSEEITLTFPEFENITGEVLAFRPSQTGLDFTLPIKVDARGQFTMKTSDMINGLWKLKINWEGDKTPFYKEAVVVIANTHNPLSDLKK